MLFLESDFSVKLISVFSPSWQAVNTVVAPRPYNALSFRLEGDAEFLGRGKDVKVGNHDILFMPENVGYELKTGSERIVVAHFELNGKKQEEFEAFTPENPELFRELFLSLCEVWEGKKPGYILRATSIFYRILEEIVKQRTQEDHSTDYDKIKAAVLYLNTHYTDSSLTIEKLCSVASISDTYFRRLFYREFGMTPVRYLAELRVSYAAELLESGYYTVRQVAWNVGFSDPKYFCTVFRKLRGCPPSEYGR